MTLHGQLIFTLTFKQLDLLYKKVRVWEGERSVERRVFYDLRLMILSLENLQKNTSDPEQKLTPEETQIIWTDKESPLVQNISSQVEIMIRWQTDFARQQESKLRQGLSGLGIWIWVVASVVLLPCFGIGSLFCKPNHCTT